MTAPRSSSGDRFSRATGAGNAATRGVILIIVAVVIGIVVIVSGLDRDDVVDVGDDAADTTTTEPAQSSTTTEPEATTSEVSSDTTPPEEVKVVVANASGGLAGLASTTRDQILVPAGYVAENIELTDASPVSTTTIFYTEGNEANAAALATLMSVPGAQVQPMPDPPPVDIGEADLLIMLGPDAGTTGSSETDGSDTTTTSPGTASD